VGAFDGAAISRFSTTVAMGRVADDLVRPTGNLLIHFRGRHLHG
jgi:hypothetical protein